MYYQLEDLEESPSARIESLNATNNGPLATVPHQGLPPVGSALSPISVYSQESWNPNSSVVPAVDIDPGQHAIFVRCIWFIGPGISSCIDNLSAEKSGNTLG